MTHRPFVIQARELASTYSTHAGLPPLAGLGSFADAVQPGLSVEESVRRHKHHHYALRRLHQLFIARITSEPLYELKMAWSHQGWLCAEYVAALRARVGEMREPPLGLEKVPHPALELIFDELLAAPLPELLLGLYETTLPAVREALQRHFTETHLLADQPTRRLLRFALIEFDEILDYGRKTLASPRRIAPQRINSSKPCDQPSPRSVGRMGRRLMEQLSHLGSFPVSLGVTTASHNAMLDFQTPSIWGSMRKFSSTIPSNQPTPRY